MTCRGHRPPLPLGTFASILVVALVVAGCGANPHAAQATRHPAAQHAAPPKVLRVTGTVTATLVGGQAPAQTFALLGVTMATSSFGWAWATSGPAAEATYGVYTADGGSHFQEAFAAPLRITDVSAPDRDHAYFLENNCLAGCVTQLQLLMAGDATPRTIWSLDGMAAGSLSFPTPQSGYIAAVRSTQGISGAAEILVTHDGGGTFSARPSPCPGQPYASAIDFLEPQQGWLLCGDALPMRTRQRKTLYATTDGGASWTAVASSAAGSLPAAGSVHSLSFTSPTTGFMSLDGYGVLRTTDGGRRWNRVFASQAPQSASQPVAVGFLPGGYGWILRNAAQPFEITADSGRTWQLGDRTPGQVQAVADLGAGHAVAYAESAGSAPTLLETADGGGQWSTAASLPFQAAALVALSQKEIAAASGRGAELSADGGRAWSLQSLPKGWQGVNIGYSSLRQGWLVAHKGDRYALFACASHGCRQLHTSFEPYSIAATGSHSAFADGIDVQGREGIFSTTDGGRHWAESVLPQRIQGLPNPEVYDGAGAKGRLRWLYRQNVLLLSDDGGVAWKLVEIDAPNLIQSATFSSTADGMLVLSSVQGPTLWATSDGGATFRFVK